MRRITIDQLFAESIKGKRIDDETMVVMPTVADVKAAKDSRRVLFKISSGSVDRDRDVINPTGWKFDNYLKNPVVMWGHQYGMPPVGTCPSLQIKGQDVLAECDFLDADTYPFADTIYRMVKAGALRAASVGFRPIKYNYNAERNGMDIEEAELLEWSVVSIPANADALVQLAIAGEGGDQVMKQFAEECERVLSAYHGCKGVWLPCEQIEKTFEAINRSGILKTNQEQTAVMPAVGQAGIDEKADTQPAPEGAAAAPVACEHGDGCDKCGADAGGLVLELADEPAEELTIDIDDDFVLVELGQVQEFMKTQVSQQLQQFIENGVREAFDYMRGRVN